MCPSAAAQTRGKATKKLVNAMLTSFNLASRGQLMSGRGADPCGDDLLFNLVVREMFVRLSKDCELSFVIATRGYFEGANPVDRISLNVSHAFDFGQIASDRGGTTSSHHVGDGQTDLHQ